MSARMSRMFTVGAALVVALGVALTGPGAAAQATTPSYIENGSDNPVSAAPAVSRPPTKHCTVTLASNFPSNAADGSPQNFSGTLTPPAGCRGPWAKVVLDYTTTVSGRQYDRSGSLQVGGATIWFGTTQEPGGSTPTTFSFSKDVTRYEALFRQPEPFSGGYGNYTSSVYTGVYSQTVTLTFYEADRDHPAPAEPDQVVGVPVPDLSPGKSSADVTLPVLPRNLTNADLEVTLKGNGCDEQWFTAAPDDVAAAMPGICAGSPYREAAFAVDGTPAGAVGTYPHIYSGGIVPTLWRPVLAIDTLDLRPENLDLTPFVGRLVDGHQHVLTASMSPIGDNWNVIATLFLWTDAHRKQTSGALTTDDVAASPSLTDSYHATGNGDELAYQVHAGRNDVVAGYVDTSAGRIYTRDTFARAFAQTGTISDSGLVQSIDEQDHVTQSSISMRGQGRGASVVRSTTLSESYPIKVDFSAASYVDDNNYSLQATVDMGQQVRSWSLGGALLAAPGLRYWDWTVDSTGVQARANGVTSAADGHSSTTYRGTDDLGRLVDTTITTDHGRVVDTQTS